MTSPFTSLADRPTADREQLVAAGHHPLAFCEFCGRPIPDPHADCDQPACRTWAIEVDMYFVRIEDGYDDRWEA